MKSIIEIYPVLLIRNQHCTFKEQHHTIANKRKPQLKVLQKVVCRLSNREFRETKHVMPIQQYKEIRLGSVPNPIMLPGRYSKTTAFITYTFLL